MALRSALLLLATCVPAASGAVVTGLSIVGGSLAGGSLLRVFGSGFDGTTSTGATTPKVCVVFWGARVRAVPAAAAPSLCAPAPKVTGA